MKVGFVLFLLMFTSWVQAYSIFKVGYEQLSSQRATHVFAVGYGKELGLQFLQTAITRIKKIQEVYPQDQIVVFWALHDTYEKDLNVLNGLNVNIIEANSRALTDDIIYRYTNSFKAIRSIHLVGHSSALYGFGLQSGSRLNVSPEKMAHLKRKLTKDAVIVLHGCNTGFYMAPQLSKELSVPVLGSLTSTDFQNIFEDSNWYHNNSGQYPRAGSWATSNSISFDDQIRCHRMSCTRLKPNNHPYAGHWGKYSTGLPFYKAFCHFSQNSRGSEKCRLGLQQMLKTWPSVEARNFSSNDAYRETVLDLLCPRLAGHSITKKCRETLSGSDQSFFFGKQMRCGLDSCEFDAIKTRDGLITFDSPDYGNETLKREYQMYMSFLN